MSYGLLLLFFFWSCLKVYKTLRSVKHKRRSTEKCLNGFVSKWGPKCLVKKHCVLQKKKCHTGLQCVRIKNDPCDLTEL